MFWRVALILCLLAAFSGCRTVRDVKVGGNRSSQNNGPASWTLDQKNLMRTRCESYVPTLTAVENARASCTCLINIAARRWSFEDFSSNDKNYIDTLRREGVVAECASDPADQDFEIRQWQSPQILRNSSEEAFYAMTPQMAFSPNGTQMAAVWVHDEQDRSSVYAKMYRDGASWTDAIYIDANNSPTAYASNPKVAFLKEDLALAIWQKDDGTLRSVWAATYNGKQWQNALNIAKDMTQTSERFVFAAANNSQALIAWSQRSGGMQNIMVRRFDGNVWQPPETISQSVGFAQQPAVTYSLSGDAYVVWSETDGSGSVKIKTNSFDGSKWAGAQDLANLGKELAHGLNIAISRSNKVAVSWIQDEKLNDNSINSKLYALTRDPSGAWEASPTLLEPQKGGDGFKGARDTTHQIGFDLNETVHLLWLKKEGSGGKLWTARRHSGSWTSKELFQPSFAGTIGDPLLAFNDAGELMAAFTQFDGTRKNALASIWKNGQWDNPEVLENVNTSVTLEAMTLHPSGMAGVLWMTQMDQEGGNDMLISIFK